MNGSLRNELESGAGLVDLPPGDLDAVVRRGRRRKTRARRATACLAALAVLAGGAVAVRVGDNEPSTSGIASGAGSASLGDSGIEWTRTDLDPAAALGGFTGSGAVDVGDALYAVSTAPGTDETDGSMSPRVLWRSEDGISWSPTEGPDFSLDELTAGTDGRLYAVGTGPAAAGGDIDAARIGWSDGDGWTDTELPLDTDALATGARIVNVGTEDVAVGPHGIVVIVRVGVDPDVPALVPDGVSTEHGWAFVDGGVGILGEGEPCPDDPEAIEKRRPASATDAEVEPGPVWCSRRDGSGTEPATIVQRLTWEELGVRGDLLRAVERKPFVFHAPSEDAPFTRVDRAFEFELGGDSAFVEASEDGFDLVATTFRPDGTGAGDLISLHSADGRTWTEGDGAEGMTWVLAAGRVDGRLALVGYSYADDRSTVQYAELVDGTWQVTDIGTLAGETFGAGAAAIGPLGVVVVGTEPRGEGDIGTTLLASRDGRTWSVEDVEALTGEDRLAVGSRVLLRADRVVVSLGIVQEDGRTPSRPIALVGTPR